MKSIVPITVALLSLGCGGKVVVDNAGIGAGGTAASSTNASTASITTGGGNATVASVGADCMCASDSDCPQVDDGCFGSVCQTCSCVESPLPKGTACLGGVCDGANHCVQCLDSAQCAVGEKCIDQKCVPSIASICAEVCPLLVQCVGIDIDSCSMGCADDLSDCSPSQLAAVESCTSFLQNSCDIDAWTSCMSGIDCIQI